MELKIDLSNKRAIAGILIFIGLLALVLYVPTILSETAPEQCFVNNVCQHEEQLESFYRMVPVFIFVGVIIGAAVFFFMTSKLEDKKKDVVKIAQILMQFLNKDEKLVVQKILENDGKVFQSEISRIEGIGKLKSHRIIQRLSDRHVIEIEKHGKTNIIKLSKNIKEVLVK